MRRITAIICLISEMLVGSQSWAKSVQLNHTQNAIKALDHKINRLQQSLSSAQNKQQVLNKELAFTETKMSDNLRALRRVKTDVASQQNKIALLQQQVHHLNEELREQQGLLAEHVRMRYQMGEYQPVKWLLNQENPYKINRLLSFYQHLIQSRQQLIATIQNTKIRLRQSQNDLNHQILSKQNLEQDIEQRQKKLDADKEYHHRLLAGLTTDIHQGQQTLAEYKQNRRNLAGLMDQLLRQSTMPQVSPFPQMRHKLPSPVSSGRKFAKKLNQGLLFYVPEGSRVSAVFPGKVVFSDWLKGYGLLLIVDHGRGFMTLYAHNQSLLKQRGERVLQGEAIAAAGHSGGILKNGLYFEVRQRGKAVPPQDWLS